ncbi:MAG: HAD family hydrolase [Lachnospiraceae bacterium]|nr:HAD family hydrolase [Lachnospiraceae bacterium]
MYRNYVFDLYGTLVDIHTDESGTELWEKLALFYGYYGAVYPPEELKKRYESLCRQKEVEMKSSMESHDAHEACPEIQIEEVFEVLFLEKGVQPELSLCVHAGQFFRALSTEYVKLYEGVPKMLEQLKKSGGNLYLLSNAQRIFTEYELNYLDIRKYFDGILISSEYGTKKPDVRFYEILLKKYDLKPGTCIMIGNDVRCDIEGARKAGMDTFYIHSNISPKEDQRPDSTFCLMKMDIPKVTALLLG